jgi:hypothetical protein
MNEPTNTPVFDSTPPAPEPFYKVWVKAVTKPNEQTFIELAASPNAKQTTAYLWIFVATLISTFLSSLVSSASTRQLMEQFGVDAGAYGGGGFGMTLISAICGAPVAAVIATIFFALGIYIFQLIAKMFGGKGTPDQLAYAMAAISAPASIVAGILSLFGAIPFVGLCFGLLSLLVSLYVLVLEVMAIKGVHQISWGAAIGTLLIPLVVIFIFCCCVVGLLTFVFGSTIGDVFSTINQSLNY